MIKVDTKEEGNTDQNSTTDVCASSTFKCGNCIACFRVTDCEKCANCLDKITPCLRRVCVQAGLIGVSEPATSQTSSSESSSKKDTNEQRKKIKKKEPKNNGVKKTKLQERLSKAVQRQQEITDSINEVIIAPKRKPHKPHKPHVWRPKELRGIKKGDEIAHQCYGPNCAKASRTNSKYCSDECGLQLADLRLKNILRGRVSDFYMLQPFAEKIDDKKIRELTVKKAETESDLELANKYAELFDLYISSLCKAEPSQLRSDQPQTAGSQIRSFLTFCPVCGIEILSERLIKHIEDCSYTQDRKFVYGSRYSLAENPYEIVCDQYDMASQTYCKRLRFACAEHYNDFMGSEMKICGYPLSWADSSSMRLRDMFSNLEDIVSGGICTRPRNSCHDHKYWEQNVRALLDNHRMRLLLYLDDLASEYFHIFEAYRTRGDALTLLVNSRQLSHESAMKEEAEYRAEQMASSGFLVQKQEELSIENLYHTTKQRRSAQTSSSSSQISTEGLLDSSLILSAMKSNELLRLLPLLQKNVQANAYNDVPESSTNTLRSCFGVNENALSGSALETLVKIEQ